MTVNINKPQINLREQLKKLERPTTDKLAVKGHDGVLLDPLTGELNLRGIDSNVGGAAVDVFVYDTSKDSDGGAWRKRTQATSWYNETLNTSTRGTRREFPAVAVIVSEPNRVIIYDGDDPDLPMWMTFEPNGIIDWPTTNTTRINISALNGILTTVTNDGGHLFKFVEDFVEIMYSSANYNINSSRTIAGRNNSTSYTSVSNTAFRVYKMITYAMNDVVMTVLPNAPIDDATGLPVPTIAVATDSGLSVVQNDGNVVDFSDNLGATRQFRKVMINGEDVIGYNYPNGTAQRFFNALTLRSDNDLEMKYNYTAGGGGGSTENISATLRDTTSSDILLEKGETIKDFYAATVDGISMYNDGEDRQFTPTTFSITDSSVAYVTSDYNTGWMHGDIKGAFLSDTDTTNVTGTNLASQATQNATARLSSETYDDGDTSWSMVDASASDNGYIQIQMNGLTAGKSYLISLTVDGNAALDGGYQHKIERTGQSTIYITHWNETRSGNATLTTTFEAVSGQNNLIFYVNAITSNISNFQVREIGGEEDRSVNNNGLAVFGTVTKTPVATGADLVAYSGFSASNYLQQPYNSILAPGTGAYSVSCWFKTGTSSGDQYIFDRNGGGTGSRNLLLIMHNNAGNANKFQFWHRDNTGNVTDIHITDKTVTDNNWHQVVALNDGSNYKVYVDGEVSSVTSSQIRNVISDNNPPMFVGIRHTGGSTFLTGSMALFRYSKSAPSPEQIKKMYEDEKVLFQENAKATLYGTSDAVTALAYDDTTNLLHAGTSGGRSTFSGLKRIENTTTAVTTAISASNGLVAEQ